jgi:phosphoglycerol transferase MdoB-like AlkP superfamily enzyme
MDKKKCLKEFLYDMYDKLIKAYIQRYLILALPFWFMDISVRLLGNKIDFYPVYYPAPNLFTLSWTLLFVGLAGSLKGIWGRIIYYGSLAVFFVMFLTNCIYYNLTNIYFSFNLLQLASEGSSYIGDTIKNIPLFIGLLILVALVLTVIVGICAERRLCVFDKKTKRNRSNLRKSFVAVVLFMLLHVLAVAVLGRSNGELQWNSFKKAGNVYENFSDANKSMRISGLYEYTLRNYYIEYLKPAEKISAEDEEFLDEKYEVSEDGTAKDTLADKNAYTGIFEGKNVIFLQLEGMDNWLLNEEDTPNLYQLMQESINFTNHYSIYSGGGSTFNSEFAVNTGFTTPISYTQNVYTLNNSTFSYSLANMFKAQGYTVNAFHMNTGEFYSRRINYLNWGYDSFNSLLDDTDDYNDTEAYELDRELILNETFYEKLFNQENQFVDYIITYTSHTPFTAEKGVGKLVAENYYGEGNVPDNLSEEEVVRLEVAETDYMVGLLLQALKDNSLYDNTVLVCYADHYLYTINDKSVLAKYKDTETNLINNTPFFIWSADLEPEEKDVVTMQMNILPTVLNLFGIEYNPDNYLLTDALADDYEGIAFFSDYSWYDGNAYVADGEVIYGEIDSEELELKTNYVNELIKKNDLTLKYDYFSKLNQ